MPRVGLQAELEMVTGLSLLIGVPSGTDTNFQSFAWSPVVAVAIDYK